MTDTPQSPRRRLIFGRRQGHRLRGRQAQLMETLLPQLKIPSADPESLDPASLFLPPETDSDTSTDTSSDMPIRLEIGFGGGEHLLARAQANPDTGFLGAEPFINGVAKLLAGIDGHGLQNIRIHNDDALELLEWLAPATLSGVDILYPDPWPKSRHRKRRFVRPETISQLARVMQPGAKLLFASDIADYVRWTLSLMLASPDFVWTAEQAGDWRNPPQDWPSTRYETKALAAGRVPTYLTFQRR